MKKGTIYTFFRFLFGVYLIWVGVNNLNKIEMNTNHVKSSIENFNKIFSIEKALNFLTLDSYLHKYNINVSNLHLNLEPFHNSAAELVYVMNFSLIIGGILCILGFGISFNFILIALLLDIIFIHNFFYFRDEKMKVNVLKIISILGAAMHVI